MKNVSPKRSPLVSVLCTTYNLEHCISKTIESILAQQFDFDYELIIHDDASTDSTCRIIESYRRRNPNTIDTIFQEKNIYRSHEGGLGHILNHYLLPAAKGKYIAICDGDDYWTDPLKLKKQISFLSGKQQYSACVTNAMVVNEMKKDRWKFFQQPIGNELSEERIILDAGSVYPTSTLVFKKSDFYASRYYSKFDQFSKYHRYDTLMIYNLLFAGKVGYVPESTAIYRRWDGGLFSGIIKEPLEICQVKEYFF